MEKQTKTERLTFKDYYKSLNRDARIDIRDRFMEETGLSYPTFYAKVSRIGFSRLEQQLINRLSGQVFAW